jgi:hypothetical protein
MQLAVTSLLMMGVVVVNNGLVLIESNGLCVRCGSPPIISSTRRLVLSCFVFRQGETITSERDNWDSDCSNLKDLRNMLELTYKDEPYMISLTK